MNPSIFRAYDIRGVVGTDLTPSVVAALGRAIGRSILEVEARLDGAAGPDAAGPDVGDGATGQVFVGRDCRTHSAEVAGWLSGGLADAGLGVTDIGMGPTPALYFAAGSGHGVMVTGSHNPPDYNGFKVVVGGEALHGDGIARLRERTAADLAGLDRPPRARGKQVRDDGAMDRYVEEILDGFGEVVGGGAGGGRGPGKSRRLKVVVDAGNGAAGPTSVATFRGLGHEVVELFCEPDGTFPNHHPDPSVPENVVDLQRRVVQEGADLGLAFDGDGDRLGVIDERGRLVAADRVGAILARRVLRSNPGATILGEVKCSDVFFDDIRRHGGRAEMGQVGHSLVKDAMRRTGAVFAAELSGHMFFADRWHGFDDAIYAGARVLELISDGPDALSALLSDLPETSATPEIRVDCDDDRKFDVVEGVRSWLQTEVGGTDAEFVTIDGVRVRLPGGWGLVRASNTQPSLVLRVEGDSPERRDQILGLLERALRSQGVPMSPGAA